MKKRTPKEVIESKKRPYTESSFAKFSGKEIKDITAREGFAGSSADMELVKKLIKENENEKLTHIHNHPNFFPYLGGIFGSPIPSSADFLMFLGDDRIKTMVIAQNNAYSGKLEGYGVFKKTKRTPDKKPNYVQRFFYETSTGVGLSRIALKHYVNKFGLNYRFVPAKDYKLNGLKNKFVKKSGIEKKVAGIIGITGVGLGLLFLSSVITGNVIGNLENLTPNLIGKFLLGIGLIGSYFWIKQL